jgi:hypothetical protein
MSGEVTTSFGCFGGRCSVRVSDPDQAAATEAVTAARGMLLDAHLTLSRFDPDSELSRLNRDRRREVPVLAIVHTIGAGSDAVELWFLIVSGAVVLPAAALLALRWLDRWWNAPVGARTPSPTRSTPRIG